jgi:hypothetical protein
VFNSLEKLGESGVFSAIVQRGFVGSSWFPFGVISPVEVD